MQRRFLKSAHIGAKSPFKSTRLGAKLPSNRLALWRKPQLLNHTFCSKHYLSLCFGTTPFYPSMVFGWLITVCCTDLWLLYGTRTPNLLKAALLAWLVCNRVKKRKPMRCENHTKYNVSRETRCDRLGAPPFCCVFLLEHPIQPALQQNRPFDPSFFSPSVFPSCTKQEPTEHS